MSNDNYITYQGIVCIGSLNMSTECPLIMSGMVLSWPCPTALGGLRGMVLGAFFSMARTF